MGDKYIDSRKVQGLILEKDNKEIRLYLYDTNKGIITPDCIFLGFDVTNEQSFEEIKKYYYENIKNKTNLIYLLGNKIDLKNKIKVTETEDIAKNFADSENIKYFSISIKDDINVNNFIEDLKSTIDNKFKDDDNKRMNDKMNFKPIKKIYKTVLLGENRIGSKTSLLNAIIRNEFDEHTSSTEVTSFNSKSFISKNNEEIIFEFWDTAGQEKYRELTKFFFIDSDVVILGFNITRYETFEEVKKFWYPYIIENSKADFIYLLGNKIDLYDEVFNYEEEEVRNFAKENNLRYFEISCKTRAGISQFIDDLVNEVF